MKIGGSLQSSDKLENLCRMINTILEDHRIVIVPGGGQFADQVRKLQKKHNLSDKSAHLMAIKGMETYGLALKDLIPSIKLSKSLKEAKESSVIYLPYKSVKNSELEQTWNVTSDSIAAWICNKTGYENLILIKRKDMINDLEKGNQASTEKLRKKDQNIVDPKIPDLIEDYKINCFLVNGEHPNRVKKLLEGKKSNYARIYPSE